MDPGNTEQISLQHLNELTFKTKEKIRLEFNQNYRSFSDKRAEFRNYSTVDSTLMEKLVSALLTSRKAQANQASFLKLFSQPMDRESFLKLLDRHFKIFSDEEKQGLLQLGDKHRLNSIHVKEILTTVKEYYYDT